MVGRGVLVGLSGVFVGCSIGVGVDDIVGEGIGLATITVGEGETLLLQPRASQDKTANNAPRVSGR